MLRFITSRFLQSLLALFLVMSATFFMVRFVPGGPLERMLQEASRGADQGGKRAASMLPTTATPA